MNAFQKVWWDDKTLRRYPISVVAEACTGGSHKRWEPLCLSVRASVRLSALGSVRSGWGFGRLRQARDLAF